MKKVLILFMAMLLFLSTTPAFAKTSPLVEVGLVITMETVFGGMSLLSTQKRFYGPIITGSFDLWMGVASVERATHLESGVHSTGFYLIGAGFLAKSFYNFRLSRNKSKRSRFWTNFIGYNALVFSGYLLDEILE